MRPKLIVFDFDDTLVDTYGVFMDYYERFAHIMSELGLGSRGEALEKLHAVDIQVVTRFGYPSLESFPLALQESYAQLAEEAGQPYDQEVAVALARLGRQVHEAPAPPYTDAEAALSALAGRVRLLLLSQGDADSQLARVRTSGFDRYFDELNVVPHKTVAVYQELTRRWDIAAESCLMVGNSIRADINPALEAGMQAVHLLREDWAYDREQPRGHYRTIKQLSELLELIEL